MSTPNKDYPHQTTIATGQPRVPQTLHEHFRTDPRGASSYPQWIKDRVWEVLQKPAIRQCCFDLSGAWYAADHGSAGAMIRQGTMYDRELRRRVVLLDGTVIKEWSGNI